MAKVKHKKKKKSFFSVFFGIFSFLVALSVIFITLALGAVMYFNYPSQNMQRNNNISDFDAIKQDEDGSYLIEVRRGETSQSVGLRLERTGLINNRHIWNVLCRISNQHIKMGTYRIEMPASILAIHRLLVSGREILHSVTIPEGVTIRRASIILEDAGICSASSFIASARDLSIVREYGIPNQTMEGYLFPDTYFFPKDFPADQVVRKMADNFFERLETIYPSYHVFTALELNEKVIIASIVEREYRIPDEAPLMAGVFFNRLRINMGLQSCATVEYIITEILGRPHPNVILNQDLQIRNPYNTYIHRGLPPGPISAPGFVSLNAAMYPERTNFLYFRLADVASGRHYFSRTHDEHIRAGQLFTKPSWP